MNIQLTVLDEDVAAIHAVIHEETAAFMARDFDRWSECFVQDDRNREVSYGSDRGVLVHKGWEKVATAMRKVMAGNPEPEPSDQGHSNIEVTVSGDIAWATFTSNCRTLPDDPYPLPDAEQVRILERHAGRWLIVYLGFAKLRIRDEARPIIQVDETARVLWATNETLGALSDFEGLAITGGRLYAKDRRFNAALKKAVSRAADLRHLFDTSHTTRSGNTFHFPCILGEAEDGGTLHCTVFVRDGVVNVTFNDAEFIKSKINAASEVFALSAAQSRLASEIAGGCCLTDIAASLGISINTARTHLSRIYDKTGVSSQHALVRVLLSMNSLPG
jgi:DNA-binding CsgD family transcriptional regulator/ketosteroid isomerase-like protein